MFLFSIHGVKNEFPWQLVTENMLFCWTLRPHEILELLPMIIRSSRPYPARKWTAKPKPNGDRLVVFCNIIDIYIYIYIYKIERTRSNHVVEKLSPNNTILPFCHWSYLFVIIRLLLKKIFQTFAYHTQSEAYSVLHRTHVMLSQHWFR